MDTSKTLIHANVGNHATLKRTYWNIRAWYEFFFVKKYSLTLYKDFLLAIDTSKSCKINHFNKKNFIFTMVEIM